jgi:uncharacterized protein (TIGR02001 family)
MKKLILASAIAFAFAGQVAYAEEAAKEHTVVVNVGAATEYRYRGLAQSSKYPAVNATIDYTHNPTGLYAGIFASTIRWIKATNDGVNNGGNAPVELDLYGGKRGEIAAGVNYDVGGLVYYYPNNKLSSVGTYTNANSFELYGQLGYGPAYIKYSHALTNLFGNPDSVNSYYVDVGANQEITDGYVLNLHYGYQRLANNIGGNYKDWKIGITKDYGVVIASVAIIDTDANPVFYSFTPGTRAAVLSLSKNF